MYAELADTVAVPAPPVFERLPLDRLVVSESNARKRGADQDLESLIANINVYGLLQPLVVRPLDNDYYEVVAGQRRLAALRRLAEERTEVAVLVPCQIVALDECGALAISLSENFERLPMEPFDQCEAFRRLIDHGLRVNEIAERFGIAPTLVKQRLALAGLLEPIKEMARDGRLNTDDAQALALVPAAKQQAWLDAEAGGGRLRGHHLKQFLFGGQPISTQVALFPLKGYPGEIVRDLFGTESFFGDAGLFWVHQNKAIAIRQEALKAEGWERVIVMETGKRFFDWEHRATGKEAGGWAFVEVTHDGAVKIREGYLPVKEAQRRERIARGEAAGEPEPINPARGEVTQPMLNYLGLHKADAVRLKVMGDPGLAIRLAVAFLVGGGANWHVRADETRPMKPDIAESCKAQAGSWEVEARREAAKARLLSPEALECARLLGARPLTGSGGYPDEGRTASLLRRLLELDDAEVGWLLAVAVADTLIAGSALTELLGQRLNVDARETWTPDSTFVALVSDKAALQAMAAELGAAPPAKATGKELRAAIRRRLDGEGGPAVTGWLPGYLKFPFEGYAPERPAPEVRAGCDRLAAILAGTAEFREPYAGVRFGPSEGDTENGEGGDVGNDDDPDEDDFSINAEEIV